MLEIIKIRLWELLKQKDVSLGMVFDETGRIHWHRGREITGKSVSDGSGFATSYIKESINKNSEVFQSNVFDINGENLSLSAKRLLLKSVIIFPIGNKFYLYLDSGIKDSFSESELFEIKVLGELLGELISDIKEKESGIGGISGRSIPINNLREKILQYSLDDNPVLLLGETGVGKSRTAELIHQYSGRKGKFVTAHMPTFQEALFESELFGHIKGSFTGAVNDKKGLIEEAAGGTLFLDEVSEIPVSFQTKLLRFIETGKYLKVGETSEHSADIRIVSASNRDLKRSVESGEFREDLYYRLAVLEIEIPPLRERPEDIELLTEEYNYLLKGKKQGKGFIDALKKHRWKGNIREMRTVMTRAGISAPDPVTGKDLSNIINSFSPTNNGNTGSAAENLIMKMENGSDFWETVKEPFLKRDLNRDQVKQVITISLRNSNGKYIDLLKKFNLKADDYKQFMKFLNKNRLQ